MEEPVVEIIESATDLTPVLDALEVVNGHLLQLQSNVDYVFLAVCMLAGVVIGCAVGWVLHDLWRT